MATREHHTNSINLSNTATLTLISTLISVASKAIKSISFNCRPGADSIIESGVAI